MNKQQVSTDQTLTPETAKERGYEWVDDLFDSVVTEKDANISTLVANLEKNGYKLGCGSGRSANQPVGLYRLLKKTPSRAQTSNG
jgi:hypothetical protein